MGNAGYPAVRPCQPRGCSPLGRLRRRDSRRFPPFSSARGCSAVARDHFVPPALTPTLASPYINILRIYRSPEGAVDAPGPSAVSAGRPPAATAGLSARPLPSAGGGRFETFPGEGAGGAVAAGAARRCPPEAAGPAAPSPGGPIGSPGRRGGGEAGSGARWRREGRESGSCHPMCGSSGVRGGAGVGKINLTPVGL